MKHEFQSVTLKVNAERHVRNGITRSATSAWYKIMSIANSPYIQTFPFSSPSTFKASRDSLPSHVPSKGRILSRSIACHIHQHPKFERTTQICSTHHTLLQGPLTLHLSQIQLARSGIKRKVSLQRGPWLAQRTFTQSPFREEINTDVPVGP